VGFQFVEYDSEDYCYDDDDDYERFLVLVVLRRIYRR